MGEIYREIIRMNTKHTNYYCCAGAFDDNLPIFWALPVSLFLKVLAVTIQLSCSTYQYFEKMYL